MTHLDARLCHDDKCYRLLEFTLNSRRGELNSFFSLSFATEEDCTEFRLACKRGETAAFQLELWDGDARKSACRVEGVSLTEPEKTFVCYGTYLRVVTPDAH